MIEPAHTPTVQSPAASHETLTFRAAPHNLEAEQALLGAILVNNEAHDRVSSFLEAHHFYDPLHQQIFETASKLIASGKQVTPITLKTYFEAAEPIDATETVPQYLGRLASDVTTTINARDYGRTIHDLAVRRALILIGEDLVNAAYDSPVDFPPREQIEEAETKLFALAASDRTRDSSELSSADDMPVVGSEAGPVQGLIGTASISVWYGPSGSGKSTLAIDCAHAVALGRGWLGRRTEPGVVLYVPLEGRSALGARMAAARGRHGPTGGRLRVLDGAITLGRASSAPSSIARLSAAAHRLAFAAELPVTLIIIDTYSRALAGDDENDAATVSTVMAQLGSLIDATGAAVLLIHHPGKDGARGPRGSSALYAAVDNVIEIEREAQAPTRNAVARKLRDGPEGPVGAFSLDLVTVGAHDDGGPITACTIVPTDAQPKPAARSASVRLSEYQQIMLTILRDAGEAGLSQTEWYEKAKAEGVGERRKATLSNTKLQLKRKGLICQGQNGWFARRE